MSDKDRSAEINPLDGAVNDASSHIRGTTEYFRALLEHANDGMFTLEGGRFVDCNQRVADMFGYAPARLIGMKPEDLSPTHQPDGGLSATRADESTAAAMRGEPQLFEWQHQRQDGTLFLAEISLNRIDVGAAIFTHAIVRDITERKTAEAEMRHRLEIEHLIAEVTARLLACDSAEIDAEISAALGRAGLAVGADRVCIFLLRIDDNRMCNAYEWRSSAISSTKDRLTDFHCSAAPWWMSKLESGDTIHAPRVADLPEEASAERRLLEPQGIQSLIVLPMTRGDRLVGFLSFCAEHPIRTWNHGDVAVMTTLANAFVSALERVRFQRKLAEKDERLELALRGADLAMWDLDLATGAIYFDERVAGTLGYDDGEIPRSMWEWRRFIHPDDVGAIVAAMGGNFDDAHQFAGGDYRIRTANGEWRWVRVSGRIVARSSDGTPTRLAGTLKDIDELKRTEDEHRRLTEQLRHAQKMELVGRLTGSVAHDFNNLLVPILTYAEILLEDMDPTSAAREDVLQIAEAARRAAALAKQLLAVSRKQLMQVQQIDLDDMVRGSEQLLQCLLRENVKLRVTLALYGETLTADPGQLQQVLMNLVINAADAMPHGGVLAVETRTSELTADRARQIPDGRAGRFATLVVSDTGHGMTREVLERIFEPFYTTKEATKGTGLGLSTIYGIVRQHDGFIEVESAPGAGSTFFVYLPFSQGAASKKRSSTPAPAKSVAPARILVVEDDAQVLTTLTDILRKEGHTVLAAHDAEAALTLVSEGPVPPDLLLADVVLPGLSGRDLHARLHIDLPGLKVLFTSGYPGHGEDIIATLGPDAFVAKPFVRNSLLRAVRQILAGTVGPEPDKE